MHHLGFYRHRPSGRISPFLTPTPNPSVGPVVLQGDWKALPSSLLEGRGGGGGGVNPLVGNAAIPWMCEPIASYLIQLSQVGSLLFFWRSSYLPNS